MMSCRGFGFLLVFVMACSTASPKAVGPDHWKVSVLNLSAATAEANARSRAEEHCRGLGKLVKVFNVESLQDGIYAKRTVNYSCQELSDVSGQ